jgi:hypothetical protein
VTDAAKIESRVRTALDRFLHPLTGNRSGRGFAFGEAVYLSHIAALIEAIDGVDFVRSLQLFADGTLQGDAALVPADALPTAGEHEIKLAVGGR